MAVTKETPVSLGGTLLNDFPGLLLLTLTKGDRVDDLALEFSESVEHLRGVNTGGENEDNRLVVSRLFVDVCKGCRLRLDEIGSKVGLDVVSNSEVDSVGSEAPKDDHLLESIFATFGLPLTGKLSVLRLGLSGGEPVVPLLVVKVDGATDTGKVLSELVFKFSDIIPSLLGDPCEWRFDGLLGPVEHGTSSQEE